MVFARVSVLLACASACVRSDVVQCDNGFVCPEGTLCVPVRGTDDRACIGADRRCGNGVLDPFALDASGQAIPAETCDDGNLTPHDGCSGACTVEQPRWRQRLIQRGAPRTLGHAAAFDLINDQIVVFGGQVGELVDRTALGSTVSCGGVPCTGWEHVVANGTPPIRGGVGLVYDGARIVMFGGVRLANSFDDLWQWDGSRWTEIIVAKTARPPARHTFALAFDSRRKRLVIHGGFDSGGGALADTWVWDGDVWTELPANPATDPPPQIGHAMAYDPVRDAIVLITKDIDGNLFVYELVDDAWTLRTPATMSPPPRSGFAAAFDATTRTVLLIGGFNVANETLRDVWGWNGTDWQPLPDLPRGSANAVAVKDPLRGEVLVVGGADESEEPVTNILRWNGQWSEDVPVAPRFQEPAATYDPVRNTIVVANGSTFELQRSRWIPSPPAQATSGATMTFDTRRRLAFAFGGVAMAAPIDTLAAYDGTAWSVRTPIDTRPSARMKAAMAYDETRDRLVLFGGSDMTNLLGDLWEWDDAASTWTQRETTNPPPRSCHVFGYDPDREQLVLFGGHDGVEALGDTWTFDGSTWRNEDSTNVVSPAPRCGGSLAWNPARRRLVLFGGEREGALLQDTWEWNGRWEPVIVQVSPPPRTNHGLTGTPRGVLLIGGDTVETDIWELVWESVIPEDACRNDRDSDGDGLAGCADPDCIASCAPLCFQEDTQLVCAPNAPICGDGVQDPLETCRTCPADVPACVPACGDLICDPGEVCAGDCPP